MKIINLERKNKYHLKKKIKKRCLQCGRLFIPYHNKQKFCSNECSNNVRKLYLQKYNKEWEKNNPIKRKIIQKRWIKENPEKVSLMQKGWREKNREYLNNYYKNYNLKPENRFKASIRRLTWNKYGSANKCIICFSKNKVQNHHLKPYDKNKFIGVCKSCHIKVHNGLIKI